MGIQMKTRTYYYRTYYYRGDIERIDQKTRARWIPGYSANGPTGCVLFPWNGKRACQSEAKRDGVKAVFEERYPL